MLESEGTKQIDAYELFKFYFHASHGDVQRSSSDNIGGGELLPNAWIWDDFHVVREITQMLHRHSYYLARFRTIGDELDGFSFWLKVLDELLEPSPLDEEFDCIFQVDAIVSYMLVALVEPTIFCFVDPLEVNKIVTRKGGLNCVPLKINLQLKINSQVVYLEKLS